MGPLTRVIGIGLFASAACTGKPSGPVAPAPPAAPPAAIAPPIAAEPPAPPPQLRLLHCGPAQQMPARVFAMLGGAGDIRTGDTEVQGGLLGNEEGEMEGGFGYGRTGFGPGGGGTGWGTIGTGRYGTIGHGSGTGSGYGVGGGRGGMHGRAANAPTVTIGQPTATGDLDKAIIRRYIKRNIQKITYCYEKQLLAKPGLNGMVRTEFRIGGDGLVAAARAKGVDEAVASCVADVVKAIEFPKPRGGGEVTVTYPFTFKAGGRPPAGGSGAVGADRWMEGGAPLEPSLPPALPSWTPYANPYERVVRPSDATIAAVQTAIAAKLDAMTACFPSAGPTGSLRVVLHVGTDGAIAPIYTGGLGDPTVEACVHAAAVTATAAAPDTEADLACDLARGDEAPWRMSRDGYEVVEVDRDSVRFHDQVFTSLPTTPPRTRDRSTVLVVADDATPAAQVERAVTWLHDERPIVLAVARGSSLAYATSFVAAPAGFTLHTSGLRPALRLRGGQVTACVDGADLGVSAPITDTAAVAKLVASVKAGCTPPSCEAVIELVPDPAQPLAEALAAIAASRNAGLEPLIAEHPSAIQCQ